VEIPAALGIVQNPTDAIHTVTFLLNAT
jgi:hypothetical protein